MIGRREDDPTALPEAPMSDAIDTVRTTPEPEGRPGAIARGQPSQVGRYRVEMLLGQGGFGQVYLARDEQLRRLVAVKVPYPWLIERPENAEAYLAEARTIAGLDHPNIVPVYDTGSTAAGEHGAELVGVQVLGRQRADIRLDHLRHFLFQAHAREECIDGGFGFGL